MQEIADLRGSSKCISPEQSRGIDLIITDVDDTLVFQSEPGFYQQYPMCVDRATADYFGFSLDEAREANDYWRSRGIGGEHTLFGGDVYRDGKIITSRTPDYRTLYDHMSKLDPSGRFVDMSHVDALIRSVRALGVKVVAVTSSPRVLSQAILTSSGYRSGAFDGFISYERDKGPPKLVAPVQLFSRVIDSFGTTPTRSLAIGDKYRYDVAPAVSLGAIGCIVGQIEDSDIPSGTLNCTIEELLSDIVEHRKGAIL